MPGVGLVSVTASSESPSADWPTRVVPRKTVRSRSALRSDGLPIRAVNEVAPAGTSTRYSWLAPWVMLGRSARTLASGPPTPVTWTGPNVLVSFQLTGAGVPAVTDGSCTTAGSTFTPCTRACSRNGLSSAGEVRRDSTSISHTPGIGFW